MKEICSAYVTSDFRLHAPSTSENNIQNIGREIIRVDTMEYDWFVVIIVVFVAGFASGA